MNELLGGGQRECAKGVQSLLCSLYLCLLTLNVDSLCMFYKREGVVDSTSQSSLLLYLIHLQIFYTYRLGILSA